ncbi:MAG: arginine--tRNA ligase [Candidatus Aenigmatarchaeota archaeon]
MSFQKFREECEKTVKNAVGESVLEIPPKEIGADLAFPCFSLAKKMQKNPVEIAKEIVKPITGEIMFSELIKRVEASGPYINFYADWNKLGRFVIKQILNDKERYCKGDKKGKVMIEFCHANTHKAFHVGHVRNICIGESLSRIMEHNGYTVIRANYQGDIGMHVAKCLWGLQNLKLKKPKNMSNGVWLGIVYAKANKRIEGSKKLEEEVNKISSDLYKSSKKLMKLWKKTRQWSLDYFGNVYKDFGVKFDKLYFESKVFERGMKIAKSLLRKKIAMMSEGAMIVDLRGYDLGVFIILKSNEDPLYSTKDLGLAELEFKEKPDRCVHVVGSEQKLYFQQLFKTFEMINKNWAEKSHHLAYELVMLKSGKMSSREGSVVLYDDLRDDGTAKAEKEIRKRKVGKANVAKDIALSAIKYSMLSRDNNKTILFDWSDVLNFEGDSGPYLQYTYARARSILRKSRKKYRVGAYDKEMAIVKKLSMFSDVIKKSAEDMKPNYLANYLFELATAFNEFYQHRKVIGSDREEELLALVDAVSIILKNGLNLLGIRALEKM